MQNHTDTRPKNDPSEDDAVQADVLIGRIIDLEATDDDQQRFEQLATADPSLWRTLAARQLDMVVLAQRVTEETAGANGVELPVIAPARAVPWTLAYSGWAAVLVIAAVWVILGGRGSSLPSDGLSSGGTPVELTADEHFEQYRGADFVIQEFEPILMDYEELPNGRLKLYIMRRTEETVITDRPLEDVVDEEDHLKIPPSQLRQESPPPRPVSNDQ